MRRKYSPSNLDDIAQLRSINRINTIDGANRHEVRNAHSRFISDAYVCITCPDAIWRALTTLKANFPESLLNEIEQEIVRSQLNNYINGEAEGA